MKILKNLFLVLLVASITNSQDLFSQVEKRVVGICERQKSSLFHDISHIVFILPETDKITDSYDSEELELLKDIMMPGGAKYNINYFTWRGYTYNYKRIYSLSVLNLWNYLNNKFVVKTIFKSQVPEKLDINTLYIDYEKLNVELIENNYKKLKWYYHFSFIDSNKKIFEISTYAFEFKKRSRQFWDDDVVVAKKAFNSNNLPFTFENLIDNPTDACAGNTRIFIGEEEINIIRYREAEKSFVKYWEKNYDNDPLEGIYKQSNFYSLWNEPENYYGILYGDSYRIAITLDETKEFYNVYYLYNNILDFKISDLIAKIYKQTETNNYEFEYTDIFLEKAGKSKVFKTDKLEFGSYKEPGENGYRYRISTKKFNYYDGKSSGWRFWESDRNESNFLIAQRTDGFFIKYNEFDSSFDFDAYFTRVYKPKRVYINTSSPTKKPTPKKIRKSPKKKAPPTNPIIID